MNRNHVLLDQSCSCTCTCLVRSIWRSTMMWVFPSLVEWWFAAVRASWDRHGEASGYRVSFQIRSLHGLILHLVHAGNTKVNKNIANPLVAFSLSIWRHLEEIFIEEAHVSQQCRLISPSFPSHPSNSYYHQFRCYGKEHNSLWVPNVIYYINVNMVAKNPKIVKPWWYKPPPLRIRTAKVDDKTSSTSGIIIDISMKASKRESFI